MKSRPKRSAPDLKLWFAVALFAGCACFALAALWVPAVLCFGIGWELLGNPSYRL